MARQARWIILAAPVMAIVSACSPGDTTQTRPHSDGGGIVPAASAEQTDPRQGGVGVADSQTCAFPSRIAQTSHLLDVTVISQRTEESPLSPRGIVRRDVPGDPQLIDIAEFNVGTVVSTRSDDPRADVFPDLIANSTLVATSDPYAGVLAELATAPDSRPPQRLIIGVGQYRIGTIEEWRVHLAFIAEDTGSLGHIGRCVNEFDRQLESIVDAVFPRFRGLSELGQLQQVVAAALAPDVGGNLRHFAQPSTVRQIGDGLMPSMVVPTVRRIQYVVVPIGRSDAAVTLQSPAGNTEFAVVSGSDNNQPWERGAIVSNDGPVALAVARQDDSRIADPLDDAFTKSLDGVEALRVDIDVESMTTEITPITLEDIADLVPSATSVDQIREHLASPVSSTPGTFTVDWIPA